MSIESRTAIQQHTQISVTRNDVTLARRAAFQAGQFLRSRREEWNQVTAEARHDTKLQADREAEALILKLLQEGSDYPILSEESGMVAESGKRQGGRGKGQAVSGKGQAEELRSSDISRPLACLAGNSSPASSFIPQPSSSLLARQPGDRPRPPIEFPVSSFQFPVSSFLWLVDPLDGTVNYSRGTPLSAVSIGLWKDGQPVYGVIYDFWRDELFHGGPGLGAFVECGHKEKIHHGELGDTESREDSEKSFTEDNEDNKVKTPVGILGASPNNSNSPSLPLLPSVKSSESSSPSLSSQSASSVISAVSSSLLRVSAVADPRSAILATGFPANSDHDTAPLQQFVASIQRFKKIRLLGTAALSLAYVAAGRVDAYAEQDIMLWDIAAGAAIVLGAGGVLDIEPSPRVPNACRLRAAATPALLQALKKG